MKKFKLKKSINEEILQPIVKVTQNENKEDKHYFNQSKYGLINYLRTEFKEGKIKLYESGAIECIRRPHSDSQPINIRTLSRS